ncbi:hypothetical protein OIU74_025015 [Salix koriyanagi]|uniref:Uncharacterized protein n=1 Tax=Salix koriyanagi TaxID=2511006 RepID=A0A9Q0W826_9ROSI|nr:hypothetical protein OIU74_025015 [Salix koriyanagi]
MMLSHANVSRAQACFEHSNFFKVTAPEARPGQLRPRSASPDRRDEAAGAHLRRTGRPNPKSNYDFFNYNNLNIRYWSWNYRGCCH